MTLISPLFPMCQVSPQRTCPASSSFCVATRCKPAGGSSSRASRPCWCARHFERAHGPLRTLICWQHACESPQPGSIDSGVSGHHDPLLANLYQIWCLGSRSKVAGLLGPWSGSESVGAEQLARHIAPPSLAKTPALPFLSSLPLTCTLTPPAGYDVNVWRLTLSPRASNRADPKVRSLTSRTRSSPTLVPCTC